MNFNILYFRFFPRGYRLIKIKLFNIFEFFSFDCEKSSIIPTIKWC
ncbi:hypothetical protein OUO_0381 [Helicobacter pylori R046Wa]|nr:hypothetical protein OUO_0381 [Helicobacter pylori R046Wa]